MANTVVKTAGGMSAAAFVKAGESGFTAARPTSEGGGIPYLKIGKETGVWTVGQENITCPKDSLWGVYPQSFAQGFVAWKGLTLEAKRMALINEPLIDPTTLPPVTAKTGWEPNVGVILVCTDCKSRPDFEGTIAIFEQRSKGGIEAWNKLYDAILARAKGGHAEFAPNVTLGHSSYEHKEWGTVYKPAFSVEDWEVPDALVADFGAPPAITSREPNDPQAQGAEVKSEARPSRRRSAPPEAVEEAVVVEDQPRRRRRAQAEGATQ